MQLILKTGQPLNRSSFALFVAILIHLLFVLLFWALGVMSPEIQKKPKEQEKKLKISLKEMPKKHKASGDTKQKVTPSPIAPPMPKGSQLKKIVKKPPVEFKPKKKPIEPKLNKPVKPVKKEPKPKPKTETIPSKKPYIPLIEPKKEIKKEQEKKPEKKDPMAWMYEDQSEKEEKSEKQKSPLSSSINQNIQELYGDEFGKLTPGQQKYILDNQEIMRRITQQVLTRVARVNLKENLNVNRTNVIEFYLHPNGDMTDFKFLEKSGYYILDDTTKETIEYAYSRYPRPDEKILVRYNVYYNLARY